MLEIVVAVPSDAQMLAEIESSQPMSAMWGPCGIKSEIESPSSLTLKAVKDGTIAGFVSAKIIPPEAQILNLAVSVKYLRLGIGFGLVKELARLAKQKDCSAVTLEVNCKNSGALNLYLKLGFIKVGIRRKFYKGADDAVLMDWKI